MSIFADLKSGYNSSILWKDFLAAISVLILLIPQGLAYGLLAGFPPIAGLYAGVVALIVYPLFASTKQLSVGPVALTSIILFSGLKEFADPMSADYIRLGLLAGLMAGIIQILLGAFRLGIITNFLSNPVISGFISAAAIIICFNQLKSLLGIELDTTSGVAYAENLSVGFGRNLNIVTTSIGVITLIVIFTLKRFVKKLPSSLFVFIIGTLLVFLFGWSQKGVGIIGELNGTLPSFQYFAFSYADVRKLLPLAFVIALVSFIDSSALAKKLLTKSQDHRVLPNMELFGLGFAKVIGSFFYAIPTSASFGRSAVNSDAGAKTQVSSWIAAILLIFSLLFLTPLFYYTPKSVLAAIIIAATFKLIDVRKMREVFRTDKRDFYAMMTCFISTLYIGIQEGILAGVLISIGLILWKTMRPHYAVLGKLQNLNVYRNVKRFENITLSDEILIMRYDDDLYFANADYFFDMIIQEINKKKGVRFLILDLSSISHIDSTGFETIELLAKSLKTSKIKFLVSGMKGPIRDLFDKRGFYKIIDDKHSFMTIQGAVNRCKVKMESTNLSSS